MATTQFSTQRMRAMGEMATSQTMSEATPQPPLAAPRERLAAAAAALLAAAAVAAAAGQADNSAATQVPLALVAHQRGRAGAHLELAWL